MPAESVFRPAPGPQTAFLQSEAFVRGYGGAMGGGKSRAICESALDYAIEHPGCPILIARQSYTSLKLTTKKTFFDEVLPASWLSSPWFKTKASMGEDWIEFPNGSIIHFAGLEDPVRWYSSQLGVLIVDQVEECDEDTIVRLMTRLRHPKAPRGEFHGKPRIGKVILSFNPENPGHWLQEWFITHAVQTDYGFTNDELYASDGDAPLGDADFFFAKATDNPYLDQSYIESTLAGLPAHLRRRYLDGIWEFITGTCYFDTEALTDYQKEVRKPRWVGATTGDITGKDKTDKIRVKPGKTGPLAVWAAPVRGEKPHRYVISVDVSSGGAADHSAMQVIDIEEFAQVAEYQAKLDPDLLAVEAYRLGKVYNNALIVPEVTGGWGFTIVRELERLGYRRIYTRRVEDRLRKLWTDKLGWDTTSKSRAIMLDTLERVLREREFVLRGSRTLAELGTFVRDDKGRPAAQPGCNDDLVITLAIGVLMATTMPRQLAKPTVERHVPVFASTGY